MKCKIEYVFIIYLMLLITVFSSVSAAKDSSGNTLEQINWSSSDQIISEIELNQQFGNLRLLQSNSSQVKLRSVVQRLDSNVKPIKLVTKIEGQKLFIDFTDEDGQKVMMTEDTVRIDTAIFLPENVPLKARVENGKLMTKQVKNDLSIESFNADLYVNSDGLLNLYTENGDIEVKLYSQANQSSIIKTSKGMISVLFDLQSFNFAVNSHGYITTNDLALLSSKVGIKPRFNMYKNKNNQNMIQLISDSGNIQIINTNKERKNDK